MSIRVMIFEDNHGLRIGLAELVGTTPGFQCVGAYPDGQDLVTHVRAGKPDVVLMDIGMPGIDGIEAVRILREHFPDIRVLMQTVFEEDTKIFASILAGASGYLLKNTPSARIIGAIRELHEGGAPMSPSIASKVLKMVVRQPADPGGDPFNLSDREKDILGCLVRGMSYKLIAESCHISIDTVRSHIRSIYDKLHVHSKGEAIAKAINKRIV